MAERQLWFLLKICLRHRLLPAPLKLLWSKSRRPEKPPSELKPALAVNHLFSVVFLLQLEVLHLLTPDQTAEMLLLPLPAPPEKHVVIDRVFDFLLESPEERNFASVLHSLVKLTKKVTFFRHSNFNAFGKL